MSTQKNIAIREKVYDKLKSLRDEEGFSSFNDTILFLLKIRASGNRGEQK